MTNLEKLADELRLAYFSTIPALPQIFSWDALNGSEQKCWISVAEKADDILYVPQKKKKVMNYYCVIDPCETCGHGEKLYIGKSSEGLLFLLYVIPEMKLDSLDDWVLFLMRDNLPIYNKDGKAVLLSDLISIIKKWDYVYGDFS